MMHLEINQLDKSDAAKLMFKLNKDIKTFKEQFETPFELEKHKIFKNISMMPEQILRVSEIMHSESRSLDEAYN